MIPTDSKPLIFLSKNDTLCLKGIALILLLVHHLFYTDTQFFNDISIHGIGIVNFIGIHCKVCVAIFVLLSGYGLERSSPLQGLSAIDFYKHRFYKLFTNFWFIWLVFVPIGFIFYGYTIASIYGENYPVLKFVLQFFGLQSILGYHGLNATWWFMTCIILLYLLFPFINKLSNRGLLIAILVSYVMQFLSIPYLWAIKFYLLPFVIGVMLARNWQFTPPHLVKKPIFWVAIMLAAFSQRAFGFIPFRIDCDTIIAVAIVVLFKISSPVFSLGMVGLRFLGVHSMNIFLFHTFVYGYYWHDLIFATRYPLIIFFSLLITCIIISILLMWLKPRIGGSFTAIFSHMSKRTPDKA